MSHRTLRLATIAVALATTSSVADGFAPSNPSIGQPQHLQHQHQPLSTVSDGEQDIHYTTSTTRTTALHYKPPMMAYRDYGDYSDETSVALDSSTFSIPLSTTKNGKKIPLETSSSTTTESGTDIDLSKIEFVSTNWDHDEVAHHGKASMTNEEMMSISPYPFASLLQGSARYIADHAGKTAVFHIPGDLIETPGFGDLIDDIAIAWLLGLKIVLVVGCRSGLDGCATDFEHAHECHNSLRATDASTLRQVEEEAGFVRFEVERRLNRSLRRQSGVMSSSKDSPMSSGNVVGGNFYTTAPYGVVGDKDCQHTGYTRSVHVQNIEGALENNDVVLLTTIAPSYNGELVNVNGSHLAAAVAKSLEAHKLIYMSNIGRVIRHAGQNNAIQDITLSFAKALTDHYRVQVNKAGFAIFEQARKKLDPGAVELLLHLGWASWAVDQGVTRAHVVNPGDGSLLEELFTAKHGTNTCLFHDDELVDHSMDTNDVSDSELSDFLAEAAAQGAEFS